MEERRKVALITGITGQDGSYLAELLLRKGYIVHGIIRKASTFNTDRIDHLYRDPHNENVSLFLHYGDLTDSLSILTIIRKIRKKSNFLTPNEPEGPIDEIYNLAAMSHVKTSFELPIITGQIDALGCLRILEAMRTCGLEQSCRFYQASTSELYGLIREDIQNENTPFYPRSPYAVAKQFAFWSLVNYREAYNMHLTNGILFNHESPRRGETFVTRKITRAVGRIHVGLQTTLYLGNLDAKRDWGHARDYVYGMWLMLQIDEADDFVLATGENHSVREFVEVAFHCIGIEIHWRGEDTDEVGYDANNPDRELVKIDPRYFRPTEVPVLLGDSTKARTTLNWEPITEFNDLVKEMVENDLLLARKEKREKEVEEEHKEEIARNNIKK